MGYENILVEIEAPIATVTLNRPKVLNALSPDLIRELTSALADLDADEGVRAVVLTGGPKVFAAGADIGDMADRGAVLANRRQVGGNGGDVGGGPGHRAARLREGHRHKGRAGGDAQRGRWAHRPPARRETAAGGADGEGGSAQGIRVAALGRARLR